MGLGHPPMLLIFLKGTNIKDQRLCNKIERSEVKRKVALHIFINSIQKQHCIPRWQRQGHTIIRGGRRRIRKSRLDSLGTLATAVCWIVRGCKIPKVNYMLFIAIWNGLSDLIPSLYKRWHIFFSIPAGLEHRHLPGAPVKPAYISGPPVFCLTTIYMISWFLLNISFSINSYPCGFAFVLVQIRSWSPLTRLGSHS